MSSRVLPKINAIARYNVAEVRRTVGTLVANVRAREIDSERVELPLCAMMNTCAYIDNFGNSCLYTTKDEA